jgi:hypothetical protein
LSVSRAVSVARCSPGCRLAHHAPIICPSRMVPAVRSGSCRSGGR